ncbi:hypothetical protein DS745_23405 [Anaerobacillus alkaliphilus]|uniref:Uncharacterized protein n=1 Tax=Anaerobacillus alkaliphilus TaxID=1548597 RepID=A0A4V1LFV9_9BACI|nr:hypothetical protein [Anaerobacillus alkaliphilus]RXI96649.1 hypothetical protein DS745_23405 [Anaerobacillus alkaliphilus]
MSLQVAIIINILLMGVASVIIYLIGKRVTSRIIKYIPAIATGVGMTFFYIKINFIPYKSHAYETINDIVAIIILAIIFGFSLVGAIIIEITNRRNGHL